MGFHQSGLQAVAWIVSATTPSLDGKAKDPVVVQLFRLDASAVPSGAGVLTDSWIAADRCLCWSPEEVGSDCQQECLSQGR